MNDHAKTAVLVAAAALVTGCATAPSPPSSRAAAAQCGYEVAFNDGMTTARRGERMDSSAYRIRCPAGARLAEARRGYRDGYVLGLDTQRHRSLSPVPKVRPTAPAQLHRGSTPRLAYQPWYTNPAGWTMLGAGLATGIGSVLMHVEFERKLELVTCQDATPACSDFSSRVQLADSAQTDQTVRDVLIGLSVTSIVAGVITFVAWKRPMPDADAGPQLSLTPTGDGRTSLGLQGRLTF